MTPAGVAAAGVMCWAPTASLLLTMLLWQQPVSKIPIHWAFNGTPNEHATSAVAFLWSLLPALVGFATTATACGLLGLIWAIGQTAAAASVHDIISFPFLLTLGIGWITTVRAAAAMAETAPAVDDQE